MPHYLKKMVLLSGISILSLNNVTLPLISSDVSAEEIKIAKSDISNFALPNNSVTFSASSNEYYQGERYEGIITLSNKAENVIKTGSKIIVQFPTEGIDVNSISLTDPILNQFFSPVLDTNTGTLTLTLKKDIVGNANINFNLSGNIIGVINQNYDVSISATDENSQTSEVINHNPSFIVKENNIIPGYGFLNSFWGLSPIDTGEFIGKSNESIANYPTGIFKSNSSCIQNFSQINYGNKFELPKDQHYRFSWYIEPMNGGSATTNIDINNIKVFNDVDGSEIPKSWYTVYLDSNRPTQQVWIDFKSEQQIVQEGLGNPSSNISYRVQLQSSVSNELEAYLTVSYNYIVTASNGFIDSTEFALANIFQKKGGSELFPVLSVEDKTFFVNDLTDKNINEKLLENITALDTIDGDISEKIIVDHSQVNPKVPGDYEVSYSVTNSFNNTTVEKAIVHIVEKEEGAPITVRYVNEDDEDIIPPEQLSGKIDDSYTTKNKTFKGYDLKKIPDNAEGIFTNQPQTVVYEYKGFLLFQSAPSQINFGNHVLSNKNEKYCIESKKGDLVIDDYRKLGSSWTMKAQIAQDFTGLKSKKVLESTLSYITKEGERREINTEENTKIIDYLTSKHETVNLSSKWLEKQSGLELEVPSGKALADQYQAVVNWTLEDGVPNN